MKTILILCSVGVVLIAAFVWNSLRMPNEYGAFERAPKVEVGELVARPTECQTKTVAIEGVVINQCETMGCYFFFESGKQQLRVDMADIAMNAPRKNGHRARVEGRMVPFGDGYQFWASAVAFE